MTTFGTTMVRRWVLDEEKFRETIEVALPASSRQAYLLRERDSRMGVLKAQEEYAAGEPARQVAAQQERDNAQRARSQYLKAFEEQIRQVSADAERRFLQLSGTAKPIGSTVCSADNRIGYVEQVAGPRLKLLLKGRAVAERDAIYGHGSALGPFKVDTSGLSTFDSIGPQGSRIELPVTDPYYLFKPHQTIRIAPIGASGGMIWDESRYWGACDWRT